MEFLPLILIWFGCGILSYCLNAGYYRSDLKGKRFPLFFSNVFFGLASLLSYIEEGKDYRGLYF